MRKYSGLKNKNKIIKNKILSFGQFTLSTGIVLSLLISTFIGIFYDENNSNTSISNNDVQNPEIINEDKIIEKLEKSQGFFTKNQGQLENDEIYFTYSSQAKTFGFSESSVLIKLLNYNDYKNVESSIIKLTFENSNKIVPNGKEKLAHKSNYFIGNKSSEWERNVPSYKKIVYENLYNGIDLVYYFSEDGLKYNWIVKPYTDPNNIIERFEGINYLSIETDGTLNIKTAIGVLKEKKPVSFQTICMDTQEIETNFEILENNRISYNIEKYDNTKELILDPLLYSTYIGGTNFEYGEGIAMDSENNAYITGRTRTVWTFPTTPGCYDYTHNGDYDVFVFKLNMAGNGNDDMIYSTYVGGIYNDTGGTIVLDYENNVYVTGWTDSPDFPTTDNCFDDLHNGKLDCFVFKLNMSSNGEEDLIYSTFVGGEGDEGQITDSGSYLNHFKIVIDFENNVYVIGYTISEFFPTTPGCYDNLHNEGGDDPYDIFIFKLKMESNGKNDLVYSTYFGGENDERGYDITLDSDNNVYICGSTMSLDFPRTTGCFDDLFEGGNEGWVSKLNMSSNGEEDLIYSSFIGGNDIEGVSSIELDSENNVYLSGATESTDFHTTIGCYEDINNGRLDLWVLILKMTEKGEDDLIYSTYIGGNEDDRGRGGIALDSNNNVYFTGYTKSPDFPTTPGCYDDTYAGNGEVDITLVKLNISGNGKDDLLYSTYIGGQNVDRSYEVLLDSNNNVYVVGVTDSLDFPTTEGCFDNILQDNREDAFVFKLSLLSAIIDSISPNPVNESEQVDFIGHGTNGIIEDYSWISNIDGFLSDKQSFSSSSLSSGIHTISFKVKNNFGIWSDNFNYTLTVNGIPTAEIDEIIPNPAVEGEKISFYGNGTDDGTIEDYYWSSSIDGYLSSEKSFDLSNLSIGIHMIYFKVKDDIGVWSEIFETTLTVNENQKPTAIIDSISPNPSQKKMVVEFKGSGIDIDGEIIKYEWDFKGDGTWDWESKTTGNTNHIYYNTGIYYPKLRVIDNSQTNGTDFRTINIQNSPPKVNNVVIHPTKPNTLDKLSINYNYFDENGDIEEGTTYKWFRDEGFGFNLTGFTTVTINFENTKKGEKWKCEITPKDGEDIGLSVNSSVVEIISIIPEVKNITINPINPKTTDGFSVSYEYYDIDNDTEIGSTFKWYKDSGEGYVYTNLNTQNVNPGKTSKGEKWRCEIIPRNEIESGISFISNFVIILNTPPIISNINFNLIEAYTIDEISVTYDFHDIDGDEELWTTYIWYKDIGNGFIDSGITSRYINSGVTLKNEKWKCEVTPSDGEEFGSSLKTNIITIKNSLPIAIIKSPINGKEFYDNNTIHFDASKSSDVDNDNLNIIWMLNSEIFSSEIKFDEKLAVGNYTIKIKVEDGFGGIDFAQVNITVINITAFDFNLVENEIIIEGTPEVDRKIKISITIHNPGVIIVNATIKFYVDTIDSDHLIGVEHISLSALKDLKVSTYWTPKREGTGTIIIIIENFDCVDLNPNNNKVQKTVKVVGKNIKESEVSNNTPIFVILIGVGAILSISIVGTEPGRYGFLSICFIPLYTRIKKEHTLDHFVRGQIFGAIKTNPGIHYSALMRQIGIGNGTLSYHINMLDKQGYIKSRNSGRLKCFYPTGMKLNGKSEYRLNELQAKIIQEIKNKPGLLQKEIIENMNEKQSTINYNILALKRANIIKLEKKGRNKHCYLMDDTFDTKLSEDEKIGISQPRQLTKKCSNCYHDVQIEFVFCNMCGKKFD